MSKDKELSELTKEDLENMPNVYFKKCSITIPDWEDLKVKDSKQDEKLKRLLRQITEMQLNAPPKADVWIFLQLEDFEVVADYCDSKSEERHGQVFRHAGAMNAGYDHVVYRGYPICLKAERDGDLMEDKVD